MTEAKKYWYWEVTFSSDCITEEKIMIGYVKTEAYDTFKSYCDDDLEIHHTDAVSNVLEYKCVDRNGEQLSLPETFDYVEDGEVLTEETFWYAQPSLLHSDDITQRLVDRAPLVTEDEINKEFDKLLILNNKLEVA